MTSYFLPGDGAARTATRRMVRVSWGTSVFVGTWLFVHIPAATYLLSNLCPRVYQIDFAFVVMYAVYIFTIAIPYTLSESEHFCQESLVDCAGEYKKWRMLESVRVKTTGSRAFDNVQNFLCRTSGLSEFWAPHFIPECFERSSRTGRRESAIDPDEIDKKGNVYSQSAFKQVTFVSCAVWFALVPSWMEILVWEEFDEAGGAARKGFLVILSLGLVWGWYGAFGVVFDKPLRAYSTCETIAKKFRRSTTRAFASTMLQKSRMALVVADDTKQGDGDVFLDLTDNETIASFWIASAQVRSKCAYRTDYYSSMLAVHLVTACLAAIILTTLSLVRSDALNNTLTLYIVSYVTVVATTVIVCLLKAVRTNDELHFGILGDLEVISFCCRAELTAVEARGEGGTEGGRKLRQNANDIDSIIRLMREKPELPGRILGVVVTRAVLAKVAAALGASMASAVLRSRIN